MFILTELDSGRVTENLDVIGVGIILFNNNEEIWTIKNMMSYCDNMKPRDIYEKDGYKIECTKYKEDHKDGRKRNKKETNY